LSYLTHDAVKLNRQQHMICCVFFSRWPSSIPLRHIDVTVRRLVRLLATHGGPRRCL